MLEIFLAFVLGCVVTGLWLNRLHEHTMSDLLTRLGITARDLQRVMQELQSEVNQEPVLPRVEVTVEQHLDQLFVYRTDTREFLGQGSNREQLLANLETRFHKDFVIVLSEEHGAKYLKKNPTS